MAIGLALSFVGCSGGSIDEADSKEYETIARAVYATPFAAKYDLHGDGEIFYRGGNIEWRYHPDFGQRFDVDIVEPDDHRTRYVLIESLGGRVICHPDEAMCSEHITELQGSDFMALELLLPVGSEWEFESGGVFDPATLVSLNAPDDDHRGSCFEFEYTEADVPAKYTECFKEGVVTLRHLDAKVEGVPYVSMWDLTNVLAPPSADTFLDPPYPIVDNSN